VSFPVSVDLSKTRVEFDLTLSPAWIHFLVVSDPQLNVGIQADSGFSCTLNGSAITFPIGGALTATLSPVIRISATGTLGIQLAWLPRVVIGFDRGSLNQNFHAFGESHTVSVTAAAGAEVYVGFDASIGVAGGKIGIGGSFGGQIDASVQRSGCMSLTTALEAALDLNASVFAKNWTFTVAHGEFGRTNLGTFCGPPQVLPAQPANPAVVSTTAKSAVLNWTDASNNETGFVSHYRVGGGSWVTGPSVPANTTSLSVSGLAAGTSYTFQVGAWNSAGTHWSAYFYGETVSLPSQPTSPKVTSATGTIASLSWTDASNNESGFVSQYRIGNGGWAAGPSVGANVTSLTISGLIPGTSYTFQVGAWNSAGTRWSAFFYGTTAPLPAQPTSPKITATTASSAVLSWTDASNNETGFVSQYRVGSGSWIAGPSVGADSTSMTISGLTPGTSYTFQVGAWNAAGTHWSVYFYGTTQQQTLPAQPTNPTVTSTTSTSASLSWTDASNNESGFIAQFRIGSGGWTQVASVPANATSMTIGGLTPSTSYTFQVGAWNSVGTRWSVYFYGSTPALPPYHAGRQVSILSLASGGVSGHTGPWNSYPTGPTRPANSAIWIVCYVNGQSIEGPFGTESIWDLSDDGYYYTDAWLHTGSSFAVVPACAPRTVTILSQATGGVSGHKGPDNSYATGPTHAANSSLTIVCYVTGQSITGPYGAESIWDFASDGYYYTDAWLHTGSLFAVVPHC
jgi:hypothetical protein